MKKIRFLFSLLSLSILVGCNSNSYTPQEEPATLDDVVFPEEEKEDDTRPIPATIPSEDSNAIEALEFEGHLNYFNNSDLHNLEAQWNGYGIHHPYIFKYNKSYYLYTSSPSTNVGIRAYKSADLVNWSLTSEAGFPLGYVSKARKTFGAFAPKVIYHNDTFYLYFNSNSGYYLFSSKSPEGPFSYDKKLNFASNYSGYIYKAPSGKLFFLAGGDRSIDIYEMNSVDEVDLNSRSPISSTTLSEYNGNYISRDFPNLVEIDNTLYLTYSESYDTYTSYRSSYVASINPDYSSSSSLAASFYSLGEGPLLVATNEMDGDIGLGDLSIVEGPDMVSYYAYYTSREDDSTRRFNLSPVNFAGSKLSLVHRENNTPINTLEVVDIKEDLYNEKTLSDSIEGSFTSRINFSNLEEIYFAYQTNNNTHVLSFDDENVKLIRRENGLSNELTSMKIEGKEHEVKISNSKCFNVYIDDHLLYSGEQNKILNGKIGYKKSATTKVNSFYYVNSDVQSAKQNSFKLAESELLSSSYYKEKSSINSDNPIKIIDNFNNLKGVEYLELSTYKDYARWLIDVKESGHYGVELVYNALFAKYENALGVRVGKNNPEYIYKTKLVSESGYIRTLTVEFDVDSGINDLLIENLSNATLRLVSARLVKLSKYSPSFSDSLSKYASKGVYYTTDFIINNSYSCHQSYEGARSFAYVGDNTISDFELTIDVAFSSSLIISGFVNIGFRCNHLASSRMDNDESSIGYFLEISQFQTRLVKHNYGYGITMGVMDLSNSINTFAKYKISMVGNDIVVYRDTLEVFRVTDPYAISSGHLGFGAYDTVGLIKNLDVHAAND